MDWSLDVSRDSSVALIQGSSTEKNSPSSTCSFVVSAESAVLHPARASPASAAVARNGRGVFLMNIVLHGRRHPPHHTVLLRGYRAATSQRRVLPRRFTQ